MDAQHLGWAARDRPRGRHTIGQSAYLYVVPGRGVAVSLLTNLTGGADEARELLSGLLDDLAGAPIQRRRNRLRGRWIWTGSSAPTRASVSS